MKYTDSHEWLSAENETATVGITKFAKQELGEIVYIELPKIGSTIKAKQELAVVESTKAAADIYSPIDGIIIEVNLSLKENLSLLNEDPENSGWICKMQITNQQQIESLLSKHEYLEII